MRTFFSKERLAVGALYYSRKLQKNLKTYEKKQTLIACAVSFLLLMLGLLALYLRRPFTSDDVVIQTIFHQHLRLDGAGTAWLGEDNYILKVPFYVFTDIVFKNSRILLLATSTLFNAIGFGLFFYSSWYFLKRFKVLNLTSRFTMVWLFSLSSVMAGWFLINPNIRNIEIGMGFIMLVGLTKYLDGGITFDGRKGKIWATLATLFLGAFLYSDPFFLGMLLAPLLIFCLSLLYVQQETRSRVSRILVFLLAGLFTMLLFHKTASLFHIYGRSSEFQFVPFSELGATISRAILGLTVLFGADFWGKNAVSVGAVRNALNAALLLFALATPFYALRGKKWRTLDPWLVFWLLQPAFITFVFIISNNTAANGFGAIRFLALLPFYIPVIFAFGYKRLTSPLLKLIIPGVLVVATCLNAAYMLNQIVHRPSTNPNQANYNLISVLQTRGITKGVGHYWNSHINTYLSNDTVTFIPVNCLQIQHFLMDDKTLQVSAKKSFYVYDSQYPQQCSEDVIRKSLGRQAETIVTTPTQKVFIYNYDITSKLTSGYFY